MEYSYCCDYEGMNTVTFFDGIEFHDIPGFGGLYAASRCGKILSKARLSSRPPLMPVYFSKARLLKTSLCKDGYETLNITYNYKSKHLRLHRLIAETFIPNPKNKPQINHINGIKNDNRVENLEWCSQSENILHAYYVIKSYRNQKPRIAHNRRFTDDQINEIKNLHNSGIPSHVLCKKFEAHSSIIARIVNKKYYLQPSNK